MWGIICMMIAVILTGCVKKSAVNMPQYKIAIPEPITATADPSQDVTIGTLDANDVSVTISSGAFSEAQEVSIHTPKDVPLNIDDQKLVGSPLEILAGSDPVRLFDKTTITFKFDKTLVPEGTAPGSMRVAYYNGQKWDYIKPVMVDMESGTMTFETYHFSLLAPKIADETKITEQFIRSQALDNVIRDGANDASDAITEQIITMTLAKMGITSEETQNKIFEKVSQAESYKEIHDLYKSGDVEGASQKVALLAGEKIAENVPDSVLKDALGGVVGAADDIAKVSEAAGYMAEGQYKQAAKIIGENIADKFLITSAGKIAVEVVQGQIDSWKNVEVDAAYQAYKNGANGYFWGYNVDKNDFNSVWDQMRGVRRQLEIEAIAKENAIREEGGMPALSDREAEIVRTRVKDAYKKQFEERSKNEDAIKKEEETLTKIFNAFKKANLFDSTLGPQGLDGKGYDYENKLEILNHFAKKMMQDTNRFEVSDKEGLVMGTKISASDLAYGARVYFSEPDGKKQYQQYLKDRFNIDPYPPLKDLSGSWSGSMTITDVIISDAMKAKINEQGGKAGEGCDVALLEEMKGKPNPITFELKPTSETGGMFVSSEEGAKPIPFTYENGEIVIPFNEEGATGEMRMKAEKTDKGFAINGNMNANYAGGDVQIKGTVGASR